MKIWVIKLVTLDNSSRFFKETEMWKNRNVFLFNRAIFIETGYLIKWQIFGLAKLSKTKWYISMMFRKNKYLFYKKLKRKLTIWQCRMQSWTWVSVSDSLPQCQERPTLRVVSERGVLKWYFLQRYGMFILTICLCLCTADRTPSKLRPSLDPFRSTEVRSLLAVTGALKSILSRLGGF